MNGLFVSLNRQEKQRFIVGAGATALIAAFAGWVYFASLDDKFGEYVVVASWSGSLPIKPGDQVFMKDAVVGRVERASVAGNQPVTDVRMTVDKTAFGLIGQGSVAWVETDFPNSKTSIIITAGIPDKLSRFMKVKPVIGVERPSDAVSPPKH